MKRGDWISERQRTPVPKDDQVKVFFRDGWLCSWCRRPTVFPLTFKLLSETVNSQLPGVPIAMWNNNWRRDKAPLLDELGACIDHREAFSAGGAHDISNFTTSCGKCNTRKSARLADEWRKVSNHWTVKGKHGEPVHWDGRLGVRSVGATSGATSGASPDSGGEGLAASIRGALR
jgi:5-methylcytosine-specific restriction endonuclease McrA